MFSSAAAREQSGHALARAMDAAEQFLTSRPVSVGRAECPGMDTTYWQTHRERFYRTAKLFLRGTTRWPLRALDVGSYYLHFAAILCQLGLQTEACDMPEFADNLAVRDRAARLGIRNVAIEPLTQLRRLPYATGQFDAVFLLETVEHWNANPRVFLNELRRIIAPGGRLVVTTPNFYGYPHLFGRLIRLLTARGGYLSVQELLTQENLMHHWKEYSRVELRELFHAYGLTERCSTTLTGIGDGTPRWVAKLCRPWGHFLYAEYEG